MSSLLVMALSNAVVVAILVLPVFALTRFVKNPWFGHGIWLVLLVKLFTPPLIEIPWTAAFDRTMLTDAAWQAPTGVDSSAPTNAARAGGGPASDEAAKMAAPVAPEVTTISVESSNFARPTDRPAGRLITNGLAVVPELLLGLWGIGSVVIAISAIRKIRGFNRLLQLAEPAPGSVQEEARQLSSALGLARFPQVYVIARDISPALWAGSRPVRLLLPRAALDRLSCGERRGVLAHELAHYKRRDHWVRWLELAATVVYWWHPAVWLARRELRFAEELCCDAMAISTAGSRDAGSYAAILLTLLDVFDADSPMLSSNMGSPAEMKRRIRILATQDIARHMPRRLRIVLGIVATAVLLFGSVKAQDARSPERSESKEPPGAPQNQKPVNDGIQPGDVLEIVVAGSLSDTPIKGNHVVEGSGEVSLGAPYGCVNLKGLSMEQAEQRIGRHLRKILQDPAPMVRIPLRPPFKVRVPPAPYRIAAGDVLLIRARGVLPEHPIDGLYRVESAGTVALGPYYGRVKISEVSLREAEKKIKKKLDTVLTDAEVAVTHGQWMLTGEQSRAGSSETAVRRKDVSAIEQKYLQLLEQLRAKAAAMHDEGAATRLNLVLAELDLAEARAKFAAERGDQFSATKHHGRAVGFADEAVSLVDQEYMAGLVNLRDVLDVAKKRLEIEKSSAAHRERIRREAEGRTVK